MSNDACGKLLSLAAHELRTPITVVAGYLKMLQRDTGGSLTPAQRKMIDAAERACDLVAALTAELGEVARLDLGETPFNRADVSLARVAQDAAAGYGAGGGRALEIRGAPVDDVVHGDFVRLSTAILALLHATARAAPDDAVLAIETATRSGDRRGVWLFIGSDAATRQLAAIDPDELVEFKEWRGGCGLGPAIARRVIEAHHGGLWSPPGDAASAAVALRLPLRHVEGS
jgi:signal transduction histidine kinase